jgi:hypothetical protein
VALTWHHLAVPAFDLLICDLTVIDGAGAREQRIDVGRPAILDGAETGQRRGRLLRGS